MYVFVGQPGAPGLLQEVFPDAPVLDQVPVLPAEPSPYLITPCVTDVRQ